MTASRSAPPHLDQFRNMLVTTTALHGMGLPGRLRLLALLIALAITAIAAPFAHTTSDAEGESTRIPRLGRHAPLVPVVEPAE